MRDALYNGKSGIVYDPVRKEMGFRSALTAIGLGALLIQNGLQEMVVCGGVQEAHPDTYIEVLVNNAGIRKDSLLLWMEQEDWSKVLGTGLDASYITGECISINGGLYS